MEAIAFVIVLEVMIHRYLIHVCVYLARHVHYGQLVGQGNVHSFFTISSLLNGGIVVLVIYHLWKRTMIGSTMDYGRGRRLLFGVDVYFMGTTLISSACFGCALALPWYSMIYFISMVLFLSLYQVKGKVRMTISREKRFFCCMKYVFF